MGERLLNLGNKRKFVDYPTVNGGFDVLRSFLSTDSPWSTGKRLSQYGKSLYLFACVSKIAQKTASIDWELFKITNKQGDKQQIFVHEALDLLYRPNPFQTKEEFFQRFMINKKLAGSTFILKVRDDRGKVQELWNLRPDYMRIILDKETVIKGFEFTTSTGTVLFEPKDIIYDSYPDPLSDFGGLSPLQPAQSRIDTEEFATKYQKNFFQNNARPDFVLMSDKKIGVDQKAEMRESWDKRHKAGKSQDNVGKGAFLEGGLKYQQVSISQTEMDYIESMRFTRDDILVALGVPKPVIAITDDVNLANAETGMKIFLSETIVPEIKALTTKLNEHLIYQEYSELYFIEFQDPVPANKTEKATIQGQRIAAGTLLINEAREEWGDEPIRGGDSLYMPIGMVPVGGKPAAKPVPVEDAKRKNIFRGRPKAYRILKEKAKIEKMMVKAVLDAAVEEGKPKRIAIIKAEIKQAYGEMVNKSIDARGDQLESALTKFITGEQKQRLMKALKVSDKGMNQKMVDDVDAALKKWAKKEETLVAEFAIPFIEDFIKSAGQQALALVAPAETFDETTQRVQKYIADRAKLLGSETTKTTVEKVSSTLAEGIADDEGISNLVDRVDSVFTDFPLYRSQMIARTEATSANNLGFTEAYKQSNVANAKEWIATGDSRTRDSHNQADGEIVGLDDKFSNGLQYPGDGSGDPAETVNCRCVLGPAFSE